MSMQQYYVLINTLLFTHTQHRTFQSEPTSMCKVCGRMKRNAGVDPSLPIDTSTMSFYYTWCNAVLLPRGNVCRLREGSLRVVRRSRVKSKNIIQTIPSRKGGTHNEGERERLKGESGGGTHAGVWMCFLFSGH